MTIADLTTPKVASPDERLLQALAELLANINRIQTFRTTITDLLAYGGEYIQQKTLRTANEELTKPEWKEFSSLKALVDDSDLKRTITKMAAERSVLVSRQVADSAALVFAHTVLDSALSECCFVSFEAAPSDWFQFVLRRKVELAALSTATNDGLRRQEALEFVAQQTRESMNRRFDLLHKVCVPKLNGAKPITHWVKRDDLESFDRIRQSVIHVQGFAQNISDVEDQIVFATMVGVCALTLVGKANNLNAGGLLDKNPTDREALLSKAFSGMIKDFPVLEQAISQMAILNDQLDKLLHELNLPRE